MNRSYKMCPMTNLVLQIKSCRLKTTSASSANFSPEMVCILLQIAKFKVASVLQGTCLTRGFSLQVWDYTFTWCKTSSWKHMYPSSCTPPLSPPKYFFSCMPWCTGHLWQEFQLCYSHFCKGDAEPPCCSANFPASNAKCRNDNLCICRVNVAGPDVQQYQGYARPRSIQWCEPCPFQSKPGPWRVSDQKLVWIDSN